MSSLQSQDVMQYDWPSGRRSSLLAEVRTAIREGLFDQAETMLHSVEDFASHDAACLNLLGVLSELRRQWKAARKYYGRAVRADRTYGAAWTNMRRLYELYTFGRSDEPVALGDERLALNALLAARRCASSGAERMVKAH